MEPFLTKVWSTVYSRRAISETKATWERLKAAGYTDLQIKKKIGGVIAEHLYYIMKDKVPMDLEKFKGDLAGLE